MTLGLLTPHGRMNDHSKSLAGAARDGEPAFREDLKGLLRRRYDRRIRIGPGLRLNFLNSSVSASLGDCGICGTRSIVTGAGEPPSDCRARDSSCRSSPACRLRGALPGPGRVDDKAQHDLASKALATSRQTRLSDRLMSFLPSGPLGI